MIITEKTLNGIARDPEYDWVPPFPPPMQPPGVRKGLQCGECGMKFDYGIAYGYYCGNQRCPTGWGR